MLVQPSIYLQKINWVCLTSVCRLKSVSHREMSTRFRKTCLSLPCPLCTLIVSSRPEASGTVIFLHFVIVLFFLFHILCFLLYACSSFLPLPSSHSIHLVSSLLPASTPPPRSTALPISLLPYSLFLFILFLSSSSYFIPPSSSYSFLLPLLPVNSLLLLFLLHRLIFLLYFLLHILFFFSLASSSYFLRMIHFTMLIICQ